MKGIKYLDIDKMQRDIFKLLLKYADSLEDTANKYKIDFPREMMSENAKAFAESREGMREIFDDLRNIRGRF